MKYKREKYQPKLFLTRHTADRWIVDFSPFLLNFFFKVICIWTINGFYFYSYIE